MSKKCYKNPDLLIKPGKARFFHSDQVQPLPIKMFNSHYCFISPYSDAVTCIGLKSCILKFEVRRIIGAEVWIAVGDEEFKLLCDRKIRICKKTDLCIGVLTKNSLEPTLDFKISVYFK